MWGAWCVWGQWDWKKSIFERKFELNWIQEGGGRRFMSHSVISSSILLSFDCSFTHPQSFFIGCLRCCAVLPNRTEKKGAPHKLLIHSSWTWIFMRAAAVVEILVEVTCGWTLFEEVFAKLWFWECPQLEASVRFASFSLQLKLKFVAYCRLECHYYYPWTVMAEATEAEAAAPSSASLP